MNDWKQTTTGLIVPGHYKPPQQKKYPIAIDLFCGAGGFSLGLIQAGFEVIARVDNSPVCAITYMHNLGNYPCCFVFDTEHDNQLLEKQLQRGYKNTKKEKAAALKSNKGNRGFERELQNYELAAGMGWRRHHPEAPGVSYFFLGDIRNLDGVRLLEIIGMERGEVDLIVGGPPCQGFSRGGKKNVMDPRNSLVFDFARLIIEIQPKTMVMENVPDIVNMVTPEGMNVVDAFCLMLEEGGYGVADALKKSLLQNPTAGGALKSKGPGTGDKKKRKKVEEAVKKQNLQPSLF